MKISGQLLQQAASDGILPAAWRYRYPFLLMPISVTLWYMSMDMADMLTGGDADFEFKAFVSMWFGLLTTTLAFRVDICSRQTGDYAFWLYLFGVLAFCRGLTMQQPDSELARFIYFLTNLGLIGIGTVLVRRVLVVFGALGCAGCLEHLASSIFQDSWLFPIALTAICPGIVYPGILWLRHEAEQSPAGCRHCCHRHCGNCLPLLVRSEGMPCSAGCEVGAGYRFQSDDGAAFSSSQLTTVSTSSSL